MATTIPTNGLQASAWAASTRTSWFSEFCAAPFAYMRTATQTWQQSREQKARANAQFAARLSERAGIARYLHDALLQGLARAYMDLQRTDLQYTSQADFAPSTRGQGSRTLEGLEFHQAPTGSDLIEAFTEVNHMLAYRSGVNFRATAIGAPRPVSPEALDEILVIGHEALANAFCHSGATEIEVDLEYTSNGLRILVRDNGCGIDAETLRHGRSGHWGLCNMRERATEMGARFRVLSRVGMGTEIELRVPGEVAFLAGEPAPTEVSELGSSVEQETAVS